MTPAQQATERAVHTADPGLGTILGQLISLLGAAVTGWTAFSARWRRMRQLDQEAGDLGGTFRLLYQFPQWLHAVILVGLVLAAVTALYGGLLSGAAPAGFTPPFLGRAFEAAARATYAFGWTLVIGGFLAGAAVFFDVIARVFVLGARVLSLTPLPRLLGRFGPDGRSIAWLQAREMVRGGADAAPLYIDENGIDRVVTLVIEEMARTGTPSYRAETPTGSAAVRANIALFACILEQAENDLHKPHRDWNPFYAACDEISRGAGLFEPEALNAHASGAAFFDELRTRLNATLTPNGQPPVSSDPATARDIATAYNLLKSRFGSDTTRLSRVGLGALGSQAYNLYRRAGQFPRLGGVMRPQFVKLSLRWEAIPLSDRPAFNPALARSIAWLLLQEGAVKALISVQDVVFAGPLNPPAMRIAIARVLTKAADAIDQATNPALVQIRTAYDLLPAKRGRWMLQQEADTALWGLASERLRAATASNWEGASGWKYIDNAAQRL